MTNRNRVFLIAAAAATAIAMSLAANAKAQTIAPATQSMMPPVVDAGSLYEAIAQAVKAHPQAVQAAGNVRTAIAGERSAVGSYLPRLSLSAGANFSPGNVIGDVNGVSGSSLNDSYRAGLSLSYDVFTGGRRGAETAQAQAQMVSAEAGLIEQQYAVTLTTKQTFFDVLRASETMKVAQARVTRAQEAHDAATQRHKLGTATQSDVLLGRSL